ncbi:MAG: radical SAM protein [Sulfuricella denitrificans]|nr:radical SAM protein [Sulfuricella denitrificans]
MAQSILIQINKAHYPVTVLGPGKRIGIWLQGCGIGCKGCVSTDTWAPDPRRAMTVTDLLAWCKRTAGNELDGITLSGGEPFDQPGPLRALLKGLHGWRKQGGVDFDILCYSGYPLKTLQQKHSALLALLDAIIPEPYAEGLPLGKLWRGSSNQSLVPLSPRGSVRFAPFMEESAAGHGKQMQVAVEGGRIWMIGIPERGDMARLEALCLSRGLSLDQVSWRR